MSKFLRKTSFATVFVLLLFLGFGIKAFAADIAIVTPQIGLNLRTGGGTNYSIIRALPRGTTVTVLTNESGWASVQTMDGITGWVASQYLEVRTELSERVAGAANIDRMVEYAKQFIGTPYVWAGASPKGFDCSGFTMYVFRQFGYNLSHNAQAQYNAGAIVSSKANLEKGDLVFFGGSARNITHVGIYIGGNQFIHAQSYGVPLGITSLDAAYYSSRYVGARRVLR
jgi:cell wall-associated NlpC family hydrolase